MNKKPSLLLYLHGFNSSPGSHKATVMIQHCQTHHPEIKVVVPQLPCLPSDTAQFLSELVGNYQRDYTIGLVGSSLGGYLSIWLNARFHLKAVLVNPAIRPYELLMDYLGEQENPYTHECYTLEAHHMHELKALDVTEIKQPDQFWLLQQMGDEVLDYRQAVEKLRDAKQVVEKDGDHSFVEFERYAEAIIQFLNLG